ncbi:MAG: hypothetical protein LBP79_02860 [Clostridiales bacterium]|nr:hypothetical protein [Clostridiales bacterium]
MRARDIARSGALPESADYGVRYRFGDSFVGALSVILRDGNQNMSAVAVSAETATIPVLNSGGIVKNSP